MELHGQAAPRPTDVAVIVACVLSSIDQDISIQQAALKAAGCTVIRADKASGTSRKGRSELGTLMQFLRRGDTLVVTRLDRLARSLRDLQNLVHGLQERGVHLKATEQPIDTSTAAGKAFLGMLGVFAEFETNLRHERQMEGIQTAKARGVYKGRPRSIDASEIRRLLDEGIGASTVAKRMGIGRASVYRLARVEPHRGGAKPPDQLAGIVLARGSQCFLEMAKMGRQAVGTFPLPSPVLPAWTAAPPTCQRSVQQGRTQSLVVPSPK